MKGSAFILVLLCCKITLAQHITHGPMTGGVTPDAVRIYIRTDAATPYIIEYSTDSLFSSFQQVAAATDASLDNTNIVSLSGLTPLTDYYFRYRINGQLENVRGAFKTFPPEGTDNHLVFVAGSCQETRNMKVYNAMPLHHPNLFIHCGDFTYPSNQIGASGGYPQDWSAIELAWRKRNEEPVCKDMLKVIPIAYMPDDDDTWGNSRFFKGGTANVTIIQGKLHNSFDLIPRTQQMRENCLSGYKKFFPGYPVQDDTDGYYHSFKVGNCEFFMLDVRSCNSGGWNCLKYDTLANWWSFLPNNQNQTLLGTKQLNWFLDKIKNSTATWKFIVSGVPFNQNIQKLIELPLLIQGVRFNIAGQAGTGFRLSYSLSDYWGAYVVERNKVLNFIKTNDIRNLIVISGDTHACAIDDGTNAGLPEMNVSGLSVSSGDSAYSTELYYQFNKILSPLGFDLKKWLWNQGGTGIGNTDLKNAFGKIEVFGKDSIQLCVIDEDNIPITCYTVKSKITATAIPQNKLTSDLISIFPNPAKDKLYIQLNKNYQKEFIKTIHLFDLSGNEIKLPDTDFRRNELIELNISGISKGEYILYLEIEKHAAAQKILRQ